MKRFIITTTSESGDHYIYYVQSKKKPTDKQLDKFLLEYGNDVDEGESFENIDNVKEVIDDNYITIK